MELAESRVEIADAPAKNDKGVAEPVQSQYDRPLYRQPTVLLVVAAYTLLSFVQVRQYDAYLAPSSLRVDRLLTWPDCV